MRRTIMSSVLVVLMGAAMSAGAEPAGIRGHGVNPRQQHQQARIEQGVRSGDLTRGEARHLQREQAAIRQEERRYRADGHLSGWERRDLHRDLDQASRNIQRERHDADRRFGAQPPGWRHDNDRGFPGHGYGWRGDDDRGFRGSQHGWSNHGNRWDHARRGPSIDDRQHAQRERIQDAWRSGALTQDERRALLAEQREIRREEQAYRADGRLTRDERAELQRELTDASRHIYNQTHDADRRY